MEHASRLGGVAVVLRLGEPGAFAHVRNVSTGAETFALSRNDHGANRIIPGDCFQHLGQRSDHFRVKGVMHIRAIEFDGDVAVFIPLGQHTCAGGGFAHDLSLKRGR